MTNKHRGSRKHYPHLVGKSDEELMEEKIRREIIGNLTSDQIKALKVLLG